MANSSATVVALTAEVRALMIGSRQVTLSVYRQLDTVDHTECEPFGRVRDAKDGDIGVYVVGRHRGTGELVRSRRPFASSDHVVDAPDNIRDLIHFGYSGRVFRRIGRFVELPMLKDGKTVIWWRFETPHSINPRWDYMNLDAERDASAIALSQLDEHGVLCRQHAEWTQLPLIVLAGLR